MPDVTLNCMKEPDMVSSITVLNVQEKRISIAGHFHVQWHFWNLLDIFQEIRARNDPGQKISSIWMLAYPLNDFLYALGEIPMTLENIREK